VFIESHFSTKGTPFTFSIIMNSAPTELSAPELHAKTCGTRIDVRDWTFERLSAIAFA
jgi:hypothetical protein